MTAGALERVPRRSLPANLLVGAITVLVLAAISVPVMLSRSAPSQDANAQELLLTAAVRMRDCASWEGEGSFAGCDAEEMSSADPGIEWRDGLALPGLKGEVGKVYVSGLDEDAYRLETTSASGKLFIYSYENGVVARSAFAGGPLSGW